MIKHKDEIQTPAILLDLDILEKNLDRFQGLADKHGKELWPMTKTHKSVEIARMQLKRGAKGFLCGTLDECEALADEIGGGLNLMYAYPVAAKPNIGRVINLANRKDCNFFLRIDNHEQAKLLYKVVGGSDTQISYTVIINTGLNRFGIKPHKTGDFLQKLWSDTNMPDFKKNLVFKGISTHPGHVYGIGKSISDKNVSDLAEDAANKMEDAVKALGETKPAIISTGSTPTFVDDVNHPTFNVLHPGNYVFNDCIQVDLHRAKEESCALTVYAAVISASGLGSNKQFIIDAGSKSFGDQGVHGSGGDNLNKYGRIKNHPGLDLCSLSEEVGRIKIKPGVNSETDLKIGAKIEIIPNHSCSTAYMTDFFICVRDEKCSVISVDMKSSSGLQL